MKKLIILVLVMFLVGCSTDVPDFAKEGFDSLDKKEQKTLEHKIKQGDLTKEEIELIEKQLAEAYPEEIKQSGPSTPRQEDIDKLIESTAGADYIEPAFVDRCAIKLAKRPILINASKEFKLIIEGESATLTGDKLTYSFVGETSRGNEVYLGNKGAKATYTFSSSYSGPAYLYFSLNDDCKYSNDVRSAIVLINDQQLNYKHKIENSLITGDDWHWKYIGIANVKQGNNIVIIEKEKATGGAFIMDKMMFYTDFLEETFVNETFENESVEINDNIEINDSIEINESEDDSNSKDELSEEVLGYEGIIDELGEIRAANYEDVLAGKGKAPYFSKCDDLCEYLKDEISYSSCQNACFEDREFGECYQTCSEKPFYGACDIANPSESSFAENYEKCSGQPLNENCDSTCDDHKEAPLTGDSDDEEFDYHRFFD